MTQIYYVNTQTGQHSRDLPVEAEDETSDGDLAGLTSQSSSRSGTSAGLGFASDSEASTSGQDIAGFGVLRRTGTPEPWQKKLADDGRTYYYLNKLDGTVQWTRPENGSRNPVSNNETTLSPSASRSHPTNGNGKTSNRLSVYSDDSDVAPFDNPHSARQQHFKGHARQTRGSPPRSQPVANLVMELTSAEKIAQSLQKALSPNPPELATELSAVAKAAIQAVVENIQTNGLQRRPEQDRRMDDLIYNAVNAVRNLLYISSSPSGQIPSSVMPRDARDSRTNSQSPLKPAQRKVTATLSRLVLSARAMQYDSGSSMSDTLNRIEIDAEELERAVLSFVLEVQRNQHAAPADEAKAPKRLNGVFTTANVGLGLVGAGAAGGWKGFGWVSLDNEAEAPKRVLGTEVIAELGSYLSRLETHFGFLGHAVRIADDTSGKQIIKPPHCSILTRCS